MGFQLESRHALVLKLARLQLGIQIRTLQSWEGISQSKNLKKHNTNLSYCNSITDMNSIHHCTSITHLFHDGRTNGANLRWTIPLLLCLSNATYLCSMYSPVCKWGRKSNTWKWEKVSLLDHLKLCFPINLMILWK